MKLSRLLLLCLASSLPLLAQDKPVPSAKAGASSPVDPQALATLQRMSATLAAAKAFTYHSENVVEVPAATGQFVTLFSSGEIALQRPNKLRARLAGEAPRFDFYYDGTTVAAFAPGTKVFSRADAPASIDEMLAGLHAETGIRLASAPLLFSDPYKVLSRDLESALVVGPATIGGVACDHLALRAPGVNWEIWIEANARALPRRLAVTFTDQPNLPRTLIEFSRWNLRPWLAPDAFTFHPPAGAARSRLSTSSNPPTAAEFPFAPFP